MKALIVVQLLKLRLYPLFWLVLALYTALVPLIFRVFFSAQITINEEQLDMGAFFALDGAGLWHYLLFAGSYGVHLFVLLMVSFVNRDFRFGIRRQYLLDGLSRRQLVGSDVSLAGLFSLAAILLLTLATYGLAWSREIAISTADLSAVAPFMLTYVLYFFVFMMMALFINSFVGNTAGSFLIVLFWSLFIEGIIRWIDPSGLTAYLPVNSLNGLIPSPFRAMAGGASVVSPDTLKATFSVLWGFLFAGLYLWRTETRDF
ncbi:hypothetical protein CYPRO_3143 [Cyclonatronum proteinivorum]|uniref:ABC-2 type transport system permease protein n=1 Tax=Cyclonatronum proteinivorum TaxID=1457365 RepID=A0A345UPH5_9BACT|nr:hypothetical protein [Cyclonatronum proteinivorum]AXJ02377.1 hypothetical protein CYPRO_3143 [Cyclonatronum proteinivorum]